MFITQFIWFLENMISYRLRFIGFQILLLAYTAQSFVLLTANIEDIKKLARKFVSDSLADKLTDLVFQATQEMQQPQDNSKTQDKSISNELELRNIARQTQKVNDRNKKDTRNGNKNNYLSNESKELSIERDTLLHNDKWQKEIKEISIKQESSTRSWRDIILGGENTESTTSKPNNNVLNVNNEKYDIFSQERSNPTRYNDQHENDDKNHSKQTYYKYKELQNNLKEPRNDYKEPHNEYKEPSNDYKKLRNDYKETSNDYIEPRNDYKEPRIDYIEPRNDYKEPRIDYKEPRNDYKEPRNDYKEPRNDYKEPRNDYKEPRNDYKEPRNDYKEPRNDYKEPRNDYKEPRNDYKEPRNDYKEPRNDYKELRNDYKEPRNDYKELRNDYKEPRNDYKEPRNDYKEPRNDYRELRSNYKEPRDDYKKSLEIKEYRTYSNENHHNKPTNKSSKADKSVPKTIDDQSAESRYKKIERDYKILTLDFKKADKKYNKESSLETNSKHINRDFKSAETYKKNKDHKPSMHLIDSNSKWELETARSRAASLDHVTTKKSKSDFDQYDNRNYPKADFVATSGNVLPRASITNEYKDKPSEKKKTWLDTV